MERNNTKTAAIIGVVVVVLLGLGVWAWSMNQDNDDMANQSSSTQMSDQNNETTTPVEQEKDVVETAIATESLSTLVAAVKAAGLVETLQGEGPFTVFAPTNAAFEKLPAGTLDTLLMPENKEQLASLLKYHVVSGEVLSTDLTNGQTVTTLNGNTLTVEINGEGVYLVDATGSRATVSQPDVTTSNGVVHVIDSVVMPE